MKNSKKLFKINSYLVNLVNCSTLNFEIFIAIILILKISRLEKKQKHYSLNDNVRKLVILIKVERNLNFHKQHPQ